MVLIGLAWIPVIQGAQGPLRLPAGRPGLPGPADLRGVLPGRVHEAAERLRAAWPRCWSGSRWASSAWPSTRRSSSSLAGFEDGYPEGSLPLDRQQHLLPVLQRAHLLRLGGDDDRRQLRHGPPSEEQIKGLTFATVSSDQKAETRRSWNQWDVINSGAGTVADPHRLHLLQRLAGGAARVARGRSALLSGRQPFPGAGPVVVGLSGRSGIHSRPP